MHVGLVGKWVNCQRVVDMIDPWGWWILADACEREGFESMTLNVLRDYASRVDGALLYAHSKGAATVDPFRDRWRRSMLARVVRPWRENAALLEEHDAVGCHWLTEENLPGMFGVMTEPMDGSGFLAGTSGSPAVTIFARSRSALYPLGGRPSLRWVG